jgi:transcriptional regulator with XRE-family HTH domain
MVEFYIEGSEGGEKMQAVFSKRLKEKRIEKKLTQKALSQLIGVEPNTIYKWEKGLIIPSIDSVQKISKVLDVPIAYLLDETETISSDFSELNISITEDNSLQKISAINGDVNAVGNTVTTVTSAPQGDDTKSTSYSYWGEVADEAEKVAARGNPKEMNRVKFALREALSTIKNAELKKRQRA